MFSVKQKREIADKIQTILRETNHPELPSGEINFCIHIDGAENWSWSDIKNNGKIINPSINPHNEAAMNKNVNLMAVSLTPQTTIIDDYNRTDPNSLLKDCMKHPVEFKATTIKHKTDIAAELLNPKLTKKQSSKSS